MNHLPIEPLRHIRVVNLHWLPRSRRRRALRGGVGGKTLVCSAKECFRWCTRYGAEYKHESNKEHAKALEQRLRQRPSRKLDRRTRGEHNQHHECTEAKDAAGEHQTRLTTCYRSVFDISGETEAGKPDKCPIYRSLRRRDPSGCPALIEPARRSDTRCRSRDERRITAQLRDEPGVYLVHLFLVAEGDFYA